MSHGEERTHWLREGAIALATGGLYGVTNVAVGHVGILINLTLRCL